MEHKPSLEDVWTDRIFDAFTKKHKLATYGARYIYSLTMRSSSLLFFTLMQ